MTHNEDVNRPGNRASCASNEPGKTIALDFESLAQGGTEIFIRFKDQEYRLRATRNGKLILNK